MTKRPKLELTWIGKEQRPRLEPRILLEDPALSYHAPHRVTDNDIFDNRLIFGDNLLALKALEQEFAGKVKCIYIDPPFNTGNAMPYYDDSLEHSLWLSMMRDRLVILLVMDKKIHKQIERIYVYGASSMSTPILKNIENSDQKFVYCIEELTQGRPIVLGNRQVVVMEPHQYRIHKGEPYKQGLKEIWASGTILDGNSSGRFFRDFLSGRWQEDGYGVLYKVLGIGDDGIGYRYFTGPKKAGATKGKYYQGIPQNRSSDVKRDKKAPLENFYDLAGSFGNCRLEGGVEFRGGKKPEKLLELLIRHFSSEGDLVLDSFAGSGTTGAVAHKMGRRWIMVELREHCHSHIVPRLRSVIDGSDQTGASKAVGWQGGGGFRYFRLAPSLLEKDRWGNWVVSRQYNAAMLAEAICKHEGFAYAPSDAIYWQHGRSTERDFLYVTTQTLTHEQLAALSEEVGADRTLLVCCTAFRANADAFPNLTLKKLPNAVLDRCEYGRDDYSLQVANLPPAPEVEPPAKPGKGFRPTAQMALLPGDGEE